MHRIAAVLAILLSALMVSTSVSVSACDLSCWLNQAPSDCHSANSASEDRMGRSTSSAMDMTAEMEMSSVDTQSNGGSDQRANHVMLHAMPGNMNMTWGAQKVISNSELTANSGIPRSKALSACSDETCSQAAASSSPPRSDENHSADLQSAVIRVSTPANLQTSFNQRAPEDPPLIDCSAAPLSPLRI